MPVLHQLLSPVPFAQVLTALLLAILFLQSGLDKVFDYSGNLSWLQSHFAKSPLRSQVKVMLIVVTVAEVLAGVLALVGAGQLAMTGQKSWAMWGAQLAALDIVLLFLGQRVAKDYAGAAALVPYFILCIGNVLLLTL
ncbi:MAG: DoxX family membrane protein [Phycisphaerales bacterium]|nr:DoxX family membrane protein [Phycisphaerales bacterium]